MANLDAFAIQRSDLNAFLFADVGVEANGMTLSVLSTLARQGMDPWDEAGRLARQPKAKAIEGLARMIATLPAGLWPLADAMPIAARLVALLPARTGGGGEAVPQAPAVHVTTLGKTLLDRLPRRGKGSGAKEAVGATGPSAFVLVLLAGLLAGLTLYLVSQRTTEAPGNAAGEMHPDSQVHAPRYRPAGATDATPGSINKGA